MTKNKRANTLFDKPQPAHVAPVGFTPEPENDKPYNGNVAPESTKYKQPARDYSQAELDALQARSQASLTIAAQNRWVFPFNNWRGLDIALRKRINDNTSAIITHVVVELSNDDNNPRGFRSFNLYVETLETDLMPTRDAAPYRVGVYNIPSTEIRTAP